MARSTLVSCVAVAALLLTGLVAWEGAAYATTKPIATLTFVTNEVTAGNSIGLDYLSSHVPATAHLYLQRQEGTAGVWKEVKELVGDSGSTTAPGVSMGAYKYRIYVATKGAAAAISGTKTLYSYGSVPMSEICAIAQTYNCGYSIPEQVGNLDFVYTLAIEVNNTYPNYNEGIDFTTNTTCRSAHIVYVQNGGNDSANSAYIELVQTSSDAEYGSKPPGGLGTFDPRFDGGPFFLDTTSTAAAEGLFVELNGTFSCYTPTGN